MKIYGIMKEIGEGRVGMVWLASRVGFGWPEEGYGRVGLVGLEEGYCRVGFGWPEAGCTEVRPSNDTATQHVRVVFWRSPCQLIFSLVFVVGEVPR